MKGWNAILQKKAMISGWNIIKNHKITFWIRFKDPWAFNSLAIFSDLDKQLMQTKTQRNLYREALGKFSSFPNSQLNIWTTVLVA